jgi:hypothetical protein
LWWDQVRTLEDEEFNRKTPEDFDADGIRNADDPQPFDPENTTLPAGPAVPLPPREDGLPDEKQPANADWVKQFNFTGLKSARVKDYINDYGQPFDEERGYGWGQDLTGNHRRRNAIEGEARDTFLFTREYASWSLSVPEGVYRVTVCVGDSGFPQEDQRVTVEGDLVVDDVSTLTARYYEATTDAVVKDGQLTIELGKQARTRNTCLNWVRMVRLKD